MRFGPRQKQPDSVLVSRWGAPSMIASVQRGTITLNNVTSNTATITAVDLNHARLTFCGYSNDVAGGSIPDRSEIKLVLTNATTITASHTTAASQICIVSYEVIEYMPGIIKSIQRGTLSITGAAVTNTATLTEVNPAKSQVDFLGWNTTETAFDLRCFATLVLTSGTVLTATRGGGTNDVTVSYQIVEWY